jgi:hypothetical protein
MISALFMLMGIVQTLHLNHTTQRACCYSFFWDFAFAKTGDNQIYATVLVFPIQYTAVHLLNWSQTVSQNDISWSIFLPLEEGKNCKENGMRKT